MEQDLRQALDRGELAVYYQPQVDLLEDRLIGVEALLRWHHPELGLLSPDRFIAQAEDSGHIIEIGSWVMRTAAEQWQAWRRQGIEVPRMAVNVSGVQFQRSNFAQIVHQIMVDTGIPVEVLELEITESMVMNPEGEGAKTLRRLRGLGLFLAIDDFGTGYSSLAYLKRLPIQRLKIDKSFVDDLGQVRNDDAIVKAILALGHNLNMEVIAEGVETDHQRRLLSALGCRQAQGFYYSRPVPADEIAALAKRLSP